MRRIFCVVLGLLILSVIFQNCSAAPEDMTGSSSAVASTSTATSLYLSSLDTSIAPNTSTQLIAAGGALPYTFSIASGGGSISALSGFYTASNISSGTLVTLMVTDALGAVALTTVTVSTITTTISGTATATTTSSYNSIYRKLMNGGSHIFTTDYSEATNGDGSYEGLVFYTLVSAVSPVGLYRCYNYATGDNFLSNSSGCEGQSYINTLGYLESAPTVAAPSPIYRCYSTWYNVMHYQTKNSAECTNAGLQIEGILGYGA